MKREQTGTAKAILEKFRSENFTGEPLTHEDKFWTAVSLRFDALETLKARRGWSSPGYSQSGGRSRIRIRNTPVAELEKVANILKRYAKKLRVAGEF
jgi:hypothetical protein